MSENLHIYSDASRYLNRELSWLEFNARVLSEAGHPSTPILERLKFLAIFSTNLDEFFMVRVAGLRKMVQEDLTASDSPDDMSSDEVLRRIRTRVQELLKQKYEIFINSVAPALKSEGLEITAIKDLPAEAKSSLKNYYQRNVLPVLTPLAVDPAHPFPFVTNLSLYLVVLFKYVNYERSNSLNPPIGLVEIPSVLPRLIPVESSKADKKQQFVLLEDLVAENISGLFLGFDVLQTSTIRVTRNLDYNLLENEVVDLLKSVQKEMTNREHQEAVCLQTSGKPLPVSVYELLKRELEISDEDVYTGPAPLVLSGLMSLYQLPHSGAHLKDPAFNPRLPAQMISNDDIFSLMTRADILLHHPFDSFYPVIELIQVAALDPHVLAIKQTLYRSSGDSPIIEALIQASENGKQVTAVVELKARFDEKNNILWARRLERAGVNVVFGFVGLKTHCKATLIIRKESSKLARYVHLSTGNYNSNTAKIYTDLGFFTSDEAYGNDVSNIFNLLTGFNILSGESKIRRKMATPELKKIFLSPLNLRPKILELIQKEVESQKATGNGLIIFKCNALTDKEIIDALYDAAKLGCKIRLIVRGMCCLRPGIAGLSENIEVISVIDRFLEHSRVYYFHANGQEDIYLASADLSPRNMDRRVELLFPIERKDLKTQIVRDLLNVYLADNCHAWVLKADGKYTRKAPPADSKEIRAQQLFIDRARDQGVQSLPYDQAIKHNTLEHRGKRPVARVKKKIN